MSKTYNVAIYIRLSREDGDNLESESITNQRDILLNYVNKDSELTFIDEYVDDGFTGSNFDRPNWQRLIRDIEKKKINAVITKDLSRMGRDYISMGSYIEKEFPEKGIRYIALNDDIDTLYETPGLEYLQFKLMFNDFYIKDGSKKIRRVLRSKKERGQYTGWKGIYGYKRDPSNKHKLIIDENIKHNVIRMFKLAKLGNGPKKIADIFSQEGIANPSVYANLNRANKTPTSKLWCQRTVGELLANPTYIGTLTQGVRKKVSYKSKKEIRIPKEDWIITEDAHEPIIDRETFYTVQGMLSKNRNKPQGENILLLTGFLYCKECSHRIGINNSNDRKRKYCVCNFYAANSKFKLCTSHSMNYFKLENAVINEIKNICQKHIDSSDFKSKVDEERQKKSLKNKLERELIVIENNLDKVNNNLDKLYLDKLNEIINLEQYNRMSLKFKEEIKNLKLSKKNLANEINSIVSSEYKKTKEDSLSLINKFLSFEKPSRELLVNLIDNIKISEDKTVEINYKFKLD